MEDSPPQSNASRPQRDPDEAIAALKRENTALNARITRLEQSLDASETGTWAWTIGSDEVHSDRRQRILLGLPEETAVTYQNAIKHVHPDDIGELTRHLECMSKVEPGTAWNHEFRIIHPTLGERWLAGIGRVEAGPDGSGNSLVGINFDITAGKSVDATIRTSEQKFRQLHESMMDAFASVDMSGRLLESNRAFREMTGYTKTELSRRTISDLTPPKWHDMEAELIAQQIIPRGYSDLYEKEYIRKDSRLIAVELRTFLIRDANGKPQSMWAIVRDISERKQSEQSMLRSNRELELQVGASNAELKRSELRYRQLAEATFEGIAVVDNGAIMDVNPQFANLFGYESAEIIGHPVMEFVSPESRELVAETIRANGEGPYEFKALRKDGSIFPAEARACMKTWQKHKIRITAIRDLSDAKEAEAKIENQRRDLDQAMRLALISEISAGIVHQIGQPLTALTINLANISQRIDSCSLATCNSADLLDSIKTDVHRMRDAVIHLRSLGRLATGHGDSDDLNDLVENVIEHLNHEAATRGIKLSHKLEPGLKSRPVNSVQMTQVIVNLIENALDAAADCPPDRRHIEVATRAITPESVEFSVRDLGTGMSPEVMKSLFTPFFTTKPEGMGIGLRLCQTIVQTHGGSIEGFNNPEENGSTFRFRLPAPQA